jgi:hypothetical protein
MQKEIEIPVFKIRCSAIGKIMTESRGKSVKQKIDDLNEDIVTRGVKLLSMKPESKSAAIARAAIEKLQAKIADLYPNINTPNLSATCISYLHSWVNEHVYQRRVEFTAKTTEKGNLVEEDAIIYASGHVAEMGLSSKNERHFSNEWMHGTPDVVGDEWIFDTKSSWNHNTFPLYETELPEIDYDWQVKGYMSLTEREKGRVVYVLMSMPEEMIQKEARWKLGQEYTQAQYDEFAKQFRYDDLPAYLRIKEFYVEHEPEKIKAIKRRVMECRDYIQNIILPALESNARKYK